MSELVERMRRAPPLASQRTQGDARRPPSKRRLAIIAAIVVAAAIVLAVGLRIAKRDTSTPAAPPADLPRVSGDAIEVPEQFWKEADLATEKATIGHLAPVVTVVGEVAFDPTLVAAVGTRAPGIVRNVLYVEGAVVEKGALLAEIESPGLADAEADKRIAEAKKRAAELNANRESKLLVRGLTTAREYEEAEAQLAEQDALDVAAKERVAALGGGGGGAISQLRAPVGGVVAERTIAPGQSVGPGLVAFRVGSLERLWVLLRVYERHLEVVRAGDAVEARPLADPDRVIEGVVAHVGSVVDPATHTANVRVEVGNEKQNLRPGQAVRATIRASGPARLALSVPASAVLFVDGRPTVFVSESHTRFVARKVELGLDAGNRVEIKTGIDDGDEVVSRNALALKAELFR